MIDGTRHDTARHDFPCKTKRQPSRGDDTCAVTLIMRRRTSSGDLTDKYGKGRSKRGTRCRSISIGLLMIVGGTVFGGLQAVDCMHSHTTAICILNAPRMILCGTDHQLYDAEHSHKCPDVSEECQIQSGFVNAAGRSAVGLPHQALTSIMTLSWKAFTPCVRLAGILTGSAVVRKSPQRNAERLR